MKTVIENLIHEAAEEERQGNKGGKRIKRGWSGLRCPLCGEEDSLRVDVSNCSLECSACGEEVKREQVEKLLAAWQSLLGWIDTAPTK